MNERIVREIMKWPVRFDELPERFTKVKRLEYRVGVAESD